MTFAQVMALVREHGRSGEAGQGRKQATAEDVIAWMGQGNKLTVTEA